MSDLATHEFAALRDTIRSRGNLRAVVFLLGVTAWAGAVLVMLSWLPHPTASVVPLLLLLATFEVVRGLHLGVERIGRYLQVFFEEKEPSPDGPAPVGVPAWERTAMAFGPSVPGAGGHPYYLPVFLMATFVNFLAALFPGPVPVELATVAVPHLGFGVWLVYCDAGMRKQRASELARFRALRAGGLSAR